MLAQEGLLKVIKRLFKYIVIIIIITFNSPSCASILIISTSCAIIPITH